MMVLNDFRDHVTRVFDDDPFDSYDILDIFFNNDQYAFGILTHAKFNISKAYDLLKISLRWRSEFNPKSVMFTSRDRDFLQKGIFYFHGTSKMGHRILRFDVAKFNKNIHHKSSYERIVSYLLEKHNKDINEPVLVLFDLTDSGLGQVDFELIKYLMACFGVYYPHLLEVMLAYNMPWVMNTAWKIIKEWLEPDSREKLQFVDIESIRNFICENNLPLHMDGTDTFLYTGDPYNEHELENGQLKKKNDPASNKQLMTSKMSESNFKKNSAMNSNRKSKQTNNECRDSLSPCLHPKELDSTEFKTVYGSAGANHRKKNKLDTTKFKACPDEKNSERLKGIAQLIIKDNLVIRPANKITVEAKKNATPQMLMLTNSGRNSLVFKMKTTSPKKYRFSQGMGVISAGATVTVKIYPSSACIHATKSVDKIQLLYKNIDDANLDVAEFWNRIQLSKVNEHRIECTLVPSLPIIPQHCDACIGTTTNHNEQERTSINSTYLSYVMLIVIIVSIANFICLLKLIIRS